jgi:hypothetical protein
MKIIGGAEILLLRSCVWIKQVIPNGLLVPVVASSVAVTGLLRGLPPFTRPRRRRHKA